MFDIFKTAIAQLGAFGMLLTLFSIVIYFLHKENIKLKDTQVAEIEKREKLLREVLESHYRLADSMKAMMDSVSEAMSKMESFIERIDRKLDGQVKN